MFGFLIGAGTAVLLALATLVVLETAKITTIERTQNPSLNLEGLAAQYPGVERAGTVLE